jgi:hypothetical protein
LGNASGKANQLIDLSVRVLRETAAAVHVTLDDPENAVWLPKSQVELEPSATPGVETLTLPEWLAIDKGLI